MSAPARSQDQQLTVKETAALLKLRPAYVYELVKQGALTAVRIPGERGYVRVPRESFDRFVKENMQKEA
jgi:excisionase family DNA binding protein